VSAVVCNAPALDLRGFRRALGSYATGVAVVTGEWQGELLGMTINSFASVSLQPPLVLWSVGERATQFEAFCAVERFAVHVLAEGQKHVSDRFALSAGDKFTGMQWDYDDIGVPRLDGCLTRFVCRKVDVYKGGDHRIVIGEVEQFEVTEARPLMFVQGQYQDVTTPRTF
tara:strand:+ start:27304 stop:27813 length:510 start_codon:yes stop_codon:yes gene_type:complete